MAEETPQTPNPLVETPPPAADPPKTESPIGAAVAPPVEEPKPPETPGDILFEEDPPEEKPEPDASARTPEQIAEVAASYKFELPEGFSVDEARMTSFRDAAAKRGLDQEGAQELLTLGLDQAKAVATAYEAAATKAWTDTLETWKTELQSDPDLGGEKSEGAFRVIGRALDQYGTPEARQAFDLTGAGWNPHIVRFVHKMAAALSEGSPVRATKPATPSARGRTPGEKLFGSNQ